MKEIKQVKLGFNKNAEVMVVADIEMKEDSDLDSLFLCFFTILQPPLRLSVITTGCLNDHLAKIYNQDVAHINKMMEDNEQMYGAMIQQSTEQLLTFGEEQNKVVLDSAKNAEQASAILASMLKHGYYIQKTRYHFPTADKQKQEQKVDISQLKPAFKTMLEICKRWNDPKLLEELQ
tara:strand:- start:1152 stop:1682 length:531 start_codon:yes stop_codon:yes gene_type:complete